ncbi:MAG: hypothetical protein CMB82_08085 [Flammeovirgaceae bacterium]|nr:hypothetical protein [Flammeovirgaceae bacterium]
MKNSVKHLALFLSAALLTFFVSCSDDDGPIGNLLDEIDDIVDEIVDSGPVLADGIYIVGPSVSADTTSANLLQAGNVGAPEFGTQLRTDFYEGYIYMGAGNYSFIKVEGETTTALGGAWTKVFVGDSIESFSGALDAGGEGESPFETGKLAHVMYDASTNQYALTTVEYWEVIGSATDGGWSAGQKIAETSKSAESVVFVGEGITMREGPYKFRFNSNWGINLEEGECDNSATACLDYFTNLGGTLDALVAGGANMEFGTGNDGVYKVTITYSPGSGISLDVAVEKTGEAEVLAQYPDSLFMIGSAIGGWDWAVNGQPLIPVYDNKHLFWKVVYLDTAGGSEFKFSPVMAWNGDFGKTGDATGGIFAKGGDNVVMPGAPGYYAITVNLEAETIEVTEDVGIYGIGGDTFGSWDGGVAEQKFTRTDSVFTSPTILADGELRIHFTSSTLTKSESTDAVDWWQAEFVVVASGAIEFRGTGGDQARTAVTAGQKVYLNFKTLTGAIE